MHGVEREVWRGYSSVPLRSHRAYGPLIKAALTLLLYGSFKQEAFAAPREICPARPADLVKNIYIFNGKPEEEIFLAPDDNRAGGGTYSVGYVYKMGRTINIRCTYASGTVTDVELKDKVDRCVVTEKKPTELSVRCH
ncbi:STY0301 family protein [Nitrospirillum sp. BR 11752]|uniref:STY0301 family protein n=1 Tax=Nitrospirillum sp. BR 11752 TaxID=3104293 RepID=UPI002EACE815|nr:STY0301 family protein [Nitrospirillum sp. BR 11752]